VSGPTEEQLLAFLEGRADATERAAVLTALDADPELAQRLRSAAAGLAMARSIELDAEATPTTTEPASPPSPDLPPRTAVPRWWIPASVAATLALAIPSTLVLSRTVAVRPTTTAEADSGASAPDRDSRGMPVGSEPSFVLVLHGTWPDASTLPPEEGQARAREYWAWTSSLAERGTLVAAGDLRWEPGARLGPSGSVLPVTADEVGASDFLVGMFALRVDSYEEALAVAEGCPHLRYGGSVSVRRVGSGFVTVPGMDDWAG